VDTIFENVRKIKTTIVPEIKYTRLFAEAFFELELSSRHISAKNR
jgi:hypothetical protein